MRPASLRPVNLLSNRPAYSPRYSPPPVLEERPVLGQLRIDPGHILAQLPESAVIGGLGATAVYAGEILPSPLNMISRVVGVSAFAYAVYQLFGPSIPVVQGGANKAEPGKGVPAGPLPFKPTELEVELDTQQLNWGGLTRGVTGTWWPGAQQCFGFILRNNTDREIQLFAGLRIDDSDGKLLWRSYPNANQGWFGRWRYTIPFDPTGKNNRVETYRCIDTSFWAKETFVTVELYRNVDDGLPFKTSAPLEIIWGVV